MGNFDSGCLDAKRQYDFGQLLDTGHADPVTVVKYGRQVVVVMAVEEYERLKALEAPTSAAKPKQD